MRYWWRSCDVPQNRSIPYLGHKTFVFLPISPDKKMFHDAGSSSGIFWQTSHIAIPQVVSVGRIAPHCLLMFDIPVRSLRHAMRHINFPIRDLAAAWDATKALDFSFAAKSDREIDNLADLQYQLADAIRNTVNHYCESIQPVLTPKVDGGTCLSDDVLSEDATIGHWTLGITAACVVWC